MAKFNKDAKVVQDLPFVTIPEFNNLTTGSIVSVELTEKVLESKNNNHFSGYSVPNLIITFKQSINNYQKADRYCKYIAKPIVGKKNDGCAMAEETFDNLIEGQFFHLKHILDTFEGTSNFIALGDVPDVEINDDAEILLEQHRAFYKVFLTAFNGKLPAEEGAELPTCYKGKEVAMKLVVNPGEKQLALPAYVKKGYLELARFDKTGKLITNLAFYGEVTTVPETIAAAKVKPGTGGMPMGQMADIDINNMI